MAVADQTILRVVPSLVLPDNVVAQNVFYCRFNDDGTSTDEQDVADDAVEWVDDILDEMSSATSDDVTPDICKVYFYDAVNDDWDELGSDLLTFTPTATGDPLPHGTAALIHAETTDPDVRASKYFTLFSEDHHTALRWTSGVLTQLANAGVQWSTDHVGSTTGATFNPGVWSIRLGAFLLLNQDIIINAIAAYQRRRKPGVGS